MPRQIDLTPHNLKVEFDPTKTLGVTLEQIINTFLSNPVVEALEKIFQTFMDAINPVNWTNPAEIIIGFQAIIQAIKDLIQWSRKWIEELFNLFNLQQVTLPTWLKELQTLFALLNLQDVWTAFVTAWNKIDWNSWTAIPQNLYAAWIAFWNILKGIANWVFTVLTNFLGNNAKNAVGAFDLTDLTAAVKNLQTAWQGIDWANWSEIPANLFKTWKAFWDFSIDIFHWALIVVTNLTNGVIDLEKAFAALDIADLKAAWDRFFTAMEGINWLSLDGWFQAGAAVVKLVFDLINWLVVVIHNIGRVDLTGLIAALELNVLGDVLETYLSTLGSIDWTLIGTFQPTGALWKFIKATIVFLQGLGNWFLAVLHNLLGIVTDVIHSMFSSVSAFISAAIGYVFGDAGVTAWQDALDLITGISNAAPWQAATAIYNDFLFVGNNIIDAFTNTFLGLPGSGFNINDLIRSIQSIPSKFLTGTMLPGQTSLINVGTLSSLIPQFLVNPTFDTIDSILGQGLWTWDGTQGPPGLATSVFTDATGVLKELLSNNISATVGQTFNISGWAQWFGFSGAANSIALTVAQFDARYNLLGYDTIASVASPGATSSGWTQLANTAYTVPATPPGIAILQLRPIVSQLASAGRVWFGNMSVTPTATTMAAPLVPLLDASKIGTGQFSQSVVSNLTSDLATLTSGVNAAALQSDLTSTWNTIISTLGGTGTGLSGIAAALSAIPGTNIAGSISTITTNIQNLIDAILQAFIPGYVAGSGTLASITTAFGAMPQANISGLVSSLNAKALAADLTNLLSAIGLGTATLTAVTNRLANLSATGTMPQAAITGLVSALNATALQSDLTALMNNLGAGSATLSAITNRFTNLTAAGVYNGNLPIPQVQGLSGYLTNLDPSSGVLSGVGAVNGLSNFLSNLDPSSGVLNGISAVKGLPSYLGYIGSNGAISVGGLVGTISINNVPTTQLTRTNINDLGNVYTTINTSVGSGCIIYRASTATVSISTNAGAQLLPGSFFDTYADTASADLTVTMGSARFQVSLAGWYRLDICLKIQPSYSAIWNICPVLFVNGSARAYGHDSISFYTAATGGASPRFLQSSFLVYLNANDYCQAGFDATNNTGSISNVLTGGSPATNYFSIALENRSLQ